MVSWIRGTPNVKDWIPVIASIASAVITALLAFIAKLFWDLKAAQLKALEESKNREIDRLLLEKEVLLKEKELEIRKLTSEKEDEVRDLGAEKDAQIRSKLLEIQTLEAEVGRLKKASPEWLKDDYETLRSSLMIINEELKKKLKNTQTQLEAKNREIEEISNSLNPNHDALEKLSLERDELAERSDIFADYIGKINGFRKQMQTYQLAAEWIDTNRQELVDSAFLYVKREKPNLLLELSIGRNGYSEGEIKRVIDDYIDWIQYSLYQGQPLDLDEINITPKFSVDIYVEAFSFIKRERAAQELPEPAADELGAFISSLVAYLNTCTSHGDAD
jgi:hypothetical protein